MKRMVNYIFLLVICLLPVVVDAKIDYKEKFTVPGYMFIEKVDDKYYFARPTASEEEDNTIFVVDKNGTFIKEEAFLEDYTTDYYEMSQIPRYRKLGDYYSVYMMLDYIYNEETKEFFNVDYEDEIMYTWNKDNEEVIYTFEDDVSIVKEVLGKRLDLYNKYKDTLYKIWRIEEYNNVFILYYRTDDYEHSLYIFDKNMNPIMTYSDYDYLPIIGYEKDGIIYLTTKNDKIDTYKIDGTKLDTINISSDWFDQEKHDYCGDYSVFDLEIIDKQLILSYELNLCDTRFIMDDTNDFAKIGLGVPRLFSLVYDLDYGINAVSSSDGEFTYETVEEDGESYVELKVTPKDGYSVEEIIVTDINGNRIEVTNNKFIKPLNDVTVEVKYVKGEYLPIPDTFLNINIWSIIIGLLFVVVGGSTLFKNLYDNKIKE